MKGKCRKIISTHTENLGISHPFPRTRGRPEIGAGARVRIPPTSDGRGEGSRSGAQAGLDSRHGGAVPAQLFGREECPAGRATTVVDPGRLIEVAVDDRIGIAGREFAIEGTKPA